MTEAELIEVEQRFRKLEDAVELAILVSHMADDDALDAEGFEEMEDFRADLEAQIEACREDMNTVHTLIRRIGPWKRGK